MRVAGIEGLERLELLACPLGLAGRLELVGQQLPQLDEHLDVERGVQQPGSGQRPGRPVGGGVLLLHPVAEQGLDQRGQPDARVAEQPSGQLGVEERARAPGRPRPGRRGPGSRRGGSTRCRPAPPGAGRASRSRSGRPGRCRRPRAGAGSGRRGRSSGSPTRARRRSRPDRSPPPSAAQASARPGGVSVSERQPVAQLEQRSERGSGCRGVARLAAGVARASWSAARGGSGIVWVMS